MMRVALLSRPWVLTTRKVGATPRVLTDDMRVFAHGRDAPRLTSRIAPGEPLPPPRACCLAMMPLVGLTSL
eukprot:1885770-Lingulodinium_polyedra.AAC.1